MGNTTLIPWCDKTFNGWIGCTHSGLQLRPGGYTVQMKRRSFLMSPLLLMLRRFLPAWPQPEMPASTEEFTDGQWRHVVIVKEKGVMRHYINGVLQSGGGAIVRHGGEHGEVAFYDYPLSGERIRAHHEAAMHPNSRG